MRLNHRIAAALTAAVFCAALPACSSDVTGTEDAGTTGGLVTDIVAVTSDSPGYDITIRLSNPDTGAVMFGPECPGILQARRHGNWMTVGDSTAVCAAVATALDVGASWEFAVPHQAVTSGEEVRYVTTWTWFNTEVAVDYRSASAAVKVGH